MEIGNSSFSRSGNLESEWSEIKEEKNSNGIEKSKIFNISVDIFDKLDTPNSIELKRRALGIFFPNNALKTCDRYEVECNKMEEIRFNFDNFQYPRDDSLLSLFC